MENITDEKKGKSVEQEQMSYARIIPTANILERATLGKNPTQSVLQSLTPMVKPVFGFPQAKESDQKTSPSAKKI
jgi:hypothetical protein